MDIQLCLDFFAVITYISDYYSKDESGTLHHIKEALKQAGNDSLKSKLALVAHTFMTHRQIGECEAYFRILPHLNLKGSNIEALFVPTGFKQNRSRFLKRLDESQTKKYENIIELADRKGKYIEKPSLIDKFIRMDKNVNEALKDLTYLQFSKRYASSNIEPREGEFASRIISSKPDNESDIRILENLDFIVTEKYSKETQRVTLPKVIAITNLLPDEPKYMRLREPRVIRLHKFSKEKNPHEYYYSELQLYMPFSDEAELEPLSLEKCKLKYEEMSEDSDRTKVQNVKIVLMKHMECVEQGTEKAHDSISTNIGNALDPAKHQEDSDCEDEGVHEDPEYFVKDPERVKGMENEKKKTTFKKILLYEDRKIEAITRNLDEEQRMCLEVAVDYAKSIVKFKKHSAHSREPPLIVIQGGAGSGKSTVIDATCQQI